MSICRHSTIIIVAGVLSGCVTDWVNEADVSALTGDTDLVEGAEDKTPEADDPVFDTEPRDTGADNQSFASGDTPWNTCAEAMASDPVDEGYFSGSMTGYNSAGMSPSCISRPTNGADGYHKVVIPAGKTLLAGFEGYGANGNGVNSQIYLMTNCNQASSCLVGRDLTGFDTVPGSEFEQISWQNTTGNDVEGYLVLGLRQSGVTAHSFDFSLSFQD
ncbi:MAG: hypothetical protein ACON5B_00335 [Myxococcota bacterium]